MYEVNRSIAVLKPKQTYLDWLRQASVDEPIKLTLEELRRDSTAVLIPAFDSPEEALDFVYQNYRELFEIELGDWFQDESVWPQNRNLRLFKAWFEVEVHAFVLDMVDEEEDGEPAEEGEEPEEPQVRGDGETLH